VSEVLNALFSYPMVVLSGLMGLVLLYWLFVILGALDVDIFQADVDVDGVLDAAADGAAEAALEGADGAFEAAEGADGALEAAEGGDAAAGGASSLLHALNLRRAPVTVVFSLVVFFAWVMTYIGLQLVGGALMAVMPAAVAGTLVLVAALLLSLPLTSLATRPLEGVFRTVSAKHSREYIGTVCQIRTSRVDERFGQARIDTDGADLVIQVRADGAAFRRGQKALIIDYDRDSGAYMVEPYDAVLDEEEEAEKARR
jgi:hypothetical protein